MYFVSYREGRFLDDRSNRFYEDQGKLFLNIAYKKNVKTLSVLKNVWNHLDTRIEV